MYLKGSWWGTTKLENRTAQCLVGEVFDDPEVSTEPPRMTTILSVKRLEKLVHIRRTRVLVLKYQNNDLSDRLNVSGFTQ